MDSITQLTLGAVVAHAIVGKKLGRSSILIGALLGTLPDLDVLFNMLLSDVDQLLWHRGYSHSWVVQAFVTPLLAYTIVRLSKYKVGFFRTCCMVFLTLSTHSLIDWFNLYGTSLFSPIDYNRYGIGITFIIDPIFSIGLIAAFIYALFKPNKRWLSYLALLICVLYAALSFGFKQQAEQTFKDTLSAHGIHSKRIISTPIAFNIMLWRLIAINDNTYQEGIYSVFDKNPHMQLYSYPRGLSLLKESDFENHPDFKKLLRFNWGFFILKEKENTLLLQDIRLGAFNHLFFAHEIAVKKNGKWVLNKHAKINRLTSFNINALIAWLFQRIGQEDLRFAP